MVASLKQHKFYSLKYLYTKQCKQCQHCKQCTSSLKRRGTFISDGIFSSKRATKCSPRYHSQSKNLSKFLLSLSFNPNFFHFHFLVYSIIHFLRSFFISKLFSTFTFFAFPIPGLSHSHHQQSRKISKYPHHQKNLLKSFNHIWETKHGSSEGNFLLWNFSLSLIFLSSLWKQRQTWPERLAGITFAVWEVEIAANPLRSSSNFWFCPKLVSYNFWKNQSVFTTD